MPQIEETTYGYKIEDVVKSMNMDGRNAREEFVDYDSKIGDSYGKRLFRPSLI